MKIEALSTLKEVVFLGSYAAAADAVNLTPSAVSLQMRQLETYLGQPLFDRSSRSVRPTAFARELVKKVESVLSEIERLKKNSHLDLSGKVRLGVTASVHTSLLPHAIASLQRQAPKLSIQLEKASTPEMLQALQANRIDAAVLVRPSGGGTSRLHWVDLLSEPLVLVAPGDMPAAPALRLLKQLPWIRLDRKLLVGRLAARYVDSQVPQKPAMIDAPGVDAIVAMIGMGLGMSVLPKLRHELANSFNVQEIALPKGAPTRCVSFVRRKNDSENKLLTLVEDAFTSAAQALKKTQ